MAQQTGINVLGPNTRNRIPRPSGDNLYFFLNLEDGLKLYAVQSNGTIFPVAVAGGGGGIPLFASDQVIKMNAAATTYEGRDFDGWGVHTSGDLITNNIFSDNVPVNASSAKTILSSLNLTSQSTVISVSAPVLTNVIGNFSIISNPALLTASFPVLINMGNGGIQNNTVLNLLTLPVLSTFLSLNIGSNPLLTAVSLPAVITGTNLFINGFGLTSVSVPNMTSVASLTVQSSPVLGPLTFPVLANATNSITINNVGSPSVSFPALVSTGPGVLNIVNNVMTSLNLSVYTGNFSITGNPNLPTFSIPSLTTAFYCFIQSNASLTSFNIPLTSVTGTLYITDNAVLSTISFPALSSVTGTITIGVAFGPSSPAVTSISLPSLLTLAGQLFIENNTVLPTVNLPLVTANVLWIRYNPALTSVVLSSLTTSSGSFSITSNSNLISIDLSALTIGPAFGIGCDDNSSLTTVTLNTTIGLPASPLTVNFEDCALSTATVDHILAAVDGWGRSFGNLQIDGGTSSGATGGFLNPNYTSLIGKGWIVGMNP